MYTVTKCSSTIYTVCIRVYYITPYICIYTDTNGSSKYIVSFLLPIILTCLQYPRLGFKNTQDTGLSSWEKADLPFGGSLRSQRKGSHFYLRESVS